MSVRLCISAWSFVSPYYEKNTIATTFKLVVNIVCDTKSCKSNSFLGVWPPGIALQFACLKDSNSVHGTLTTGLIPNFCKVVFSCERNFPSQL